MVMLEHLLSSFADLFTVLCVFFICLGSGNILLKMLKLEFSNIKEECLFSVGLGLGFIPLIILPLGLAHVLYPLLIFSIFLFLFFCVVKRSGVLCRELVEALRKDWQISDRGILSSLFVAASILIVYLVYLKSLTPPIDNDPLIYHLELPKRFLLNHSIEFLPYTANSVFPFFMEMFYTLGLALRGPECAQLFHWGFGVITAFGIYTLVKNELKLFPSLLATALFLSIPGIFHQMPTANNDVAMTCFLFLIFYAVWRGIESKNMGWYLLAGCFVGYGFGIKLIMAIGVLSIAMAYGLISLKANKLRFLKSFCVVFIIALLVSCVWYIRAYIYTGNPFFPYFSSWFGLESSSYDLAKHGMGKGWVAFVLLPWNMIMHPNQFGGMGNQLGPIFLLIIPCFLVFFRKMTPLVRFALLVFFSYWGLWFFGPQNLRFFFPVLPVLCLLMVYTYQEIEEIVPIFFINILRILLLIYIGVCVLFAAYFLKSDWKVALGVESSVEYLNQNERSYEMAQWINQELPEDAKILSQEVKLFYVDRNTDRLKIYLSKKQNREKGLIQQIKLEGYTHILLLSNILSKTDEEASSLQSQILNSSVFNEVKQITFNPSENPKNKTQYRLYEIL